jgi:hypothetical protein
MDKLTDNGLIRVVLLLTTEQASQLDNLSRAAALSRSSYVRARFDQIFAPRPGKTDSDAHQTEVAA